MLKAQAYIFELLYKLETPHPIDSFVAIADYSNWALSQSSPQLAKLTLDLARRYPFTPVTYAVSVPWYFKVVWTFAKPFMSQASVDKFSVISVDELATKVAPEHIGPELGGTLQYSVAEWISKRFKAEGLDEAHISSHSLHHQFEDALARLETTYSSIAPLAVKKGSLLKQGGGGYFGTNSWKSRVFIIGHDGCFYYFADTKAAGKPHRTYDLAGCSVELPGNEANAEKPYSFYFHSGGTQVSLAASSESDRTEWVDALNAAIKSRQEAAEAEKAASASE